MKPVSQTRQFSRDVKRMRKRGKDLGKLREVVKLLAEGIPLAENCKDHPRSWDRGSLRATATLNLTGS